ncbi:MAG: CRISPR-associated helicase Cas3' [Acidimicrobiia bacterium]|nr:CRISPR-associated helicase Cas3' [Acidimicrobiia bacterium]
MAEKLGGFAASAGLLIHAHHGGLKRLHEDFGPWLKEKRNLPGPKRALEAVREEIPDLLEQDSPVPPGFIQNSQDARDVEFFLRMTYSALVDADSLDTVAHKLSGAPPERVSTATLAELWGRYRAFLARQAPVPDSAVNRVRRDVHDACLRAANQRRGVFRLTVPTGGGKTRSAMAFAIRHGMEHGLRRIIVAVPFTTITEQTAHVYRDIFENGFGDTVPIVLEHHSAATEGVGKSLDAEDNFAPGAVWQRLSAENWDAPIVVTTTVQLFESLFSNRRGKTRKLHNVAGSVIVLDEAQALPAGLLSPILDALHQLTKNYGASVVLSTATQPAFECISEFRDVPACEIVPESDYRRHFNELRRVDYQRRTDAPHQWSEVAGWMRDERSALAIVNTKRHAMELLDALDDPDALHISTLLCGAHRRNVIEEITKRLESGGPCRVVSTQVVEAGVDLDFDTVYRAEAPLDAIIQAAGRCNREGRLEGRGRVVVFNPPDEAAPAGVYSSGRDITRILWNLGDFDPNDLEMVRRYFEWLYDAAVDPDEHDIQNLRWNLNFPEVADRFRMIPDGGYDVIVDYPKSSTRAIEALVEQLRTRERSPREILRQLQQHTVSLRAGGAERLLREGLIEEIIPGVGRWHGDYNPVRGLTEADPERII